MTTTVLAQTAQTAQTAPAAPERCPAAARVHAEFWSGELLFCVHHAREHHQRLLDFGAKLVLLPPP